MQQSNQPARISREEIIQLRMDLVAARAFEPARVATMFKFVGHLILAALFAAGCYWLSRWTAVLLLPLCALSWVIAVMIGHDAAHRALFKSRWANTTLRCIAFPLLSGMSGLFWHYKHNVLHHTNPNVVGYDEDLEVLPFAIGVAFHRGSNKFFRWIQRHAQCAWLFWPLTTMLSLDLRTRSIRYLISHARLKGVDGEWIADASMMVCHWILFLILPALIIGVVPVLEFYILCWTIAGVYLSIVGLAGHTALPLIESYDDHVAIQFLTTRSLRLNPVLSWCFVGLDRQIEHHLFPQIPHLRLPRATPIVKEFARRHGLPYCENTFFECLRDISHYVNRSWEDAASRLEKNVLETGTDAPCRPTWGRLRSGHMNRPVRISSAKKINLEAHEQAN